MRYLGSPGKAVVSPMQQHACPPVGDTGLFVAADELPNVGRVAMCFGGAEPQVRFVAVREQLVVELGCIRC